MAKQLFKESFQFNFDQVELLEEKTILRERAGEGKYSAFAILKKVPVSRFTKNKNGRIYSKRLWELMKSQGVAEGTDCLADHPTDDGSVKDLVGIWKNLQLDNNMVYGDLWLLEGGMGWGVLFYNKLKAGGKCGLSSVGYGELDIDQTTVIPESYELVRLGDWVIDPSQSVFATFDNLQEEVMEATAKPAEEKTELKEEIIPATETNIISEKTEEPLKEAPLPDSLKEKKEDIKMSETTTKIQEAHFKNHVKTLIREATKNPNLVEGQQTLQDLYKTIPAELPELRESVEVKLEELAQKLDEQVKEANTKIEENKVSSVEMKKRYDALKEAFDKLKSKNEELKEVNSELAEDRKKMESDLAQFIADRKMMESDLGKFGSLTEEGKKKAAELAESVKKMEEATAQFAKDRKLMEADISKLVESNKLMEKDIALFETDRKAMLEDIKQLTTDRVAMLEDIKQFLNDRKLMEADIAKLNEQLAAKLTEDKAITGHDDNDGKDDVTFSHAGKDTAVARIEADLIGKEKSGVAMKLPEPKQGKAMKENMMDKDMDALKADKEEEGKDEEKNELEELGLKMEKSNFYQNQIKEFFAEEAKKFPALNDFEKEVLASKSLVEAVRKVDQYKSTKVDGKPIKLSEGFTKSQNTPSWLERSF